MKNINFKKINTRRIVSGALYDFASFLTTMKKSIIVGSKENCVSDILDVLIEFSNNRGLNINDKPDIQDWNKKI